MAHESPDRTVPSSEEPLLSMHKSQGIPNIVYRMCRTPDSKRVVAGWMVYEDFDNAFSVEKGWDIPPTPLPRPYEIRPVEGKGRGMFALRDISRGELIVRERPIILNARRMVAFTGAEWFTADKGFLQLLYWLEPADRKRFLSLHNCKPAKECGPLSGIIHTNALCVDFAQSKFCSEYGAVCLEISIVNHSCSPNASYSNNQESVTFELRANRDIAADEEITIRYTNVLFPRMDRQSELQSKYYFHCTCFACSAGPASDERRKLILSTLISLAVTWSDWLASAPRDRAARTKRDLKHFLTVVHAMDEEQLAEHREEVTQRLALMYAGIGDGKNFTKWATETVLTLRATSRSEEQRRLLGQWESWLSNPTSVWLWGTWC